MLVKYVRRENQLIGCVVALDAQRIGWSQCHLGKDVFKKDRAKEIAIGRAKKGSNNCPVKQRKEEVSPVLQECVIMMERAKRYFK